MTSLPYTRMVSLAWIITCYHYRSTNCKVIQHIHIARIKEISYIDSWIIIEFNIMNCSSFKNIVKVVQKLTR
jgi:hypothetical protein